jgi:fatty-acid desaturase
LGWESWPLQTSGHCGILPGGCLSSGLSYPSLPFQNNVYEWARDHRAHHKFSETHADPHNSCHGLLFSHVGWLLVHKQPAVKEKGGLLDISDLKAEKLVMFQRRRVKVEWSWGWDTENVEFGNSASFRTYKIIAEGVTEFRCWKSWSQTPRFNGLDCSFQNNQLNATNVIWPGTVMYTKTNVAELLFSRSF